MAGDIRARRRELIAALFDVASPPLPRDQAERLAVILPHLIRITVALSGEVPGQRDAVIAELRGMLHQHLQS